MYEVDDRDTVVELHNVPSPDVGAPLPHLVCDEHHVLLAYLINEPDPAWDEEWERNLVDAAMERVKLRVRPEHYQIFYLSAVKGLKTGEVARMLQVNIGQVYLIRHRLAKDVKREVERLKEKPL